MADPTPNQVCDTDVRLVYEHGEPYGIRDRTGFICFFHRVPKFDGQDDRYRSGLAQRARLADFLTNALQSTEPREPFQGSEGAGASDNPASRESSSREPSTHGQPSGRTAANVAISEGSADRASPELPSLPASESREPSDDVAQLMRFYDVTTLEALVERQHHHIERLQAKLPPTPDTAARRVREG